MPRADARTPWKTTQRTSRSDVSGIVREGIEVWAGLECSYNRVGERYFDQLDRCRLYEDTDALDRLAALGIRALRFPVVWERYCALGERAWAWTDASLEQLRRRGIAPIVGLVHHGSGPEGVSLLDEAFPERLAGFARLVAERYPWVERFTPINEPLTTARFATLYGHWYPHVKSPQHFARAVLIQIRAISAAMRAIRDVSPNAVLVQTEDLGKTYASEVLRYQADFENERRWLTYDLLCGRVIGRHPMAAFLRWAGVPNRDLEAVAASPCPPDIIGVNHYLTSERYLDHRLDRYPLQTHGGNHRHRYADVEAVRVLARGVAGPYGLLRETWQRYQLPLAVTEAHLACTREHQLRWLDEVWHAALRLRREGADVRAVTAWSAYGAWDWSSLLTRTDGNYESGLFDARGRRPRPTALAAMVRSIATHGSFDHPVLHSPGWWRSERRLTYAPLPSALRLTVTSTPRSGRARPVLIVGCHGTLGRAVTRACDARELEHVALPRTALDIADEHAVAQTLALLRPWCVINCAGFVRVDDAERERNACRRTNAEGAATLARACASHGAKLVTFSTDLVFDGAKRSPYVESDAVRPLCEYGRTKAEAERAVLVAARDALIVRTAAFFGDHDDYNFVTLALRALAAGEPFEVTNDVVVSPTYVPDLVDSVLDLAIDNAHGVWHLTNDGAVTWEELAREAARVAEVGTSSLRGVSVAELRLPAPRPLYTAMTSERATIMAPLGDALTRYARARSWERPRAAVAVPDALVTAARLEHDDPDTSTASTHTRAHSRPERVAAAGDGA